MALHEYSTNVAYSRIDGSLPPQYSPVKYHKKAAHEDYDDDDRAHIVAIEDSGSEGSSIDEKYDVESVHSSVGEEEHLT